QRSTDDRRRILPAAAVLRQGLPGRPGLRAGRGLPAIGILSAMDDVAVTPAQPQTAPRSALLIVFLVVVIDLLGFAIVLPLLPRIAQAYLAGVGPSVRGLTIGLLFSSFSAMQFIFAPLWGRLSDRIGRRPILLVGLAGSVV